MANSIRKIGARYWTADWTTNGPGVCFFVSNGALTGGGNASFEIRPVAM